MRKIVLSIFAAWVFITVVNAQGKQTSKATAANTSAIGNPSVGEKDEKTPAVATYLNASNKNAIKITLKVSRQQAVAGSDFGVTAIIENISASPIYFVPAAFSMTPPPEIDTEGPRDWLAFFPGILVPQSKTYEDTVIVLEPGSNISAFWAGQKPSALDDSAPKTLSSRVALEFQGFYRAVTFSPGQYSLAIVGSYWDTHEGAQLKSVEHHTQTAEIVETITAPQKVVLLGAALGGIIAFLLLSRLYPAGAWAGVKLVTGLTSAVLLSTIVTILLSRLSQSQFIVQVTVNDFWGAMAAGFLITATGPAVLQKFVGLVQGTNSVNKPGGAEPAVSETKRAQPILAQEDSAVVKTVPEPDEETTGMRKLMGNSAKADELDPNGNKYKDLVNN